MHFSQLHEQEIKGTSFIDALKTGSDVEFLISVKIFLCKVDC